MNWYVLPSPYLLKIKGVLGIGEAMKATEGGRRGETQLQNILGQWVEMMWVCGQHIPDGQAQHLLCHVHSEPTNRDER